MKNLIKLTVFTLIFVFMFSTVAFAAGDCDGGQCPLPTPDDDNGGCDDGQCPLPTPGDDCDGGQCPLPVPDDGGCDGGQCPLPVE